MQIEYDDNIENFKAQIEKLSLWLWGNRIKEKNISFWLENFNGIQSQNVQEEKKLALTLLSQFMFYDLREVRQALKSIYKDLYMAPIISSFRKKTDSYKMHEYNMYLQEEMKKTRFLSVGNPSESSSLLLYFFRQKNNLSRNYFAESCQFLMHNEENQKINHLVFIDDLSASGNQAITNLKKIVKNIRDIYASQQSEINISYFTLFATSEALELLRNAEDANNRKLFDRVESIFELDATYKAFNPASRYFTSSEKRDFFHHLCTEEYVIKCKPEDIKDHKQECGYGDTQLLLGFFYNIPNNTLPIFWSENSSWKPLFKRYNKKYRLGL